MSLSPVFFRCFRLYCRCFSVPPFLLSSRADRRSVPLSSRSRRGVHAPVIPSPSRDLYTNIVVIFIEILRLHFVSLRMTKGAVLFNNQIARPKTTLLPKYFFNHQIARAKTTFFASAPNLPKPFGSPERGECGALMIESIWRAPQRGKRLFRKGSGCPSKSRKTAASLLRGLREKINYIYPADRSETARRRPPAASRPKPPAPWRGWARRTVYRGRRPPQGSLL